MKKGITSTLLLFSLAISAQTTINWAPVITVASNQTDNMHPRVALDGSGNPVVIWGNGSAKKVYFSRWSSGSFTAPVQLNPDAIPVFAASWAGPDLTAKGDTIYVVYKETPEDVNGIYLTRSVNGGVDFSEPYRVDQIGDSISRFPAVGITEAGQPLVAFMKFNPGWTNARYVCATSQDLGETFGIDVPASGFSGGHVCDCCPASVQRAGNVAAVFYRDNLNDLRNSWVGISSNGGANFSNGIGIDDTDWMINACPSSGPDGFIDGNSVYSVFMSAATGKTRCYISKSSLDSFALDSIQPFTPEFNGLSQQNFPRIAHAGTAAGVVWRQLVNGQSQLAFQFTDQIGNNFPGNLVTLANSGVENADIAMAPGKICIVWESNVDGTVKFLSGTYAIPTSGIPSIASEEGLKLYPNPLTQNQLHIKLPEPAADACSYRIFDWAGQAVLTGSIPAETQQFTIDLAVLPAGCYWISVESSGMVKRETFIRL